MNKSSLGRLEHVDLHEAWGGEATDFTPWLAQPENIKLLGEAISIELEVESQETKVGPFRADILCRDTLTDRWVLIENQLERTDHVHLGQLLTYAAGLDAVTIVWLAARFTEEHRAALDWLNNATTAGFNFFGLEIELWRIADSPVAPKFNVVSKPNDWSKAVRQAADSGQLTELQQLRLDFWTQFGQYLASRGSPIRIWKPTTGYWSRVALGRNYFGLIPWIDVRDENSGVALDVSGPNVKAYFGLIKQRHRDIVEAQLSSLGTVEWHRFSKNRQIWVICPSTPAKTETWPALNEWMAEALETMHKLFSPIVKALDASEYVGTGVEDDVKEEEEGEEGDA